MSSLFVAGFCLYSLPQFLIFYKVFQRSLDDARFFPKAIFVCECLRAEAKASNQLIDASW